MRTDHEIQDDVIAELNSDPRLRDSDVAVSVRDGVVTLAGYVDNFAVKWTAERIASMVKGVKAVADTLDVKLPTSSERPDPELARAIVDALEWNILVPSDRIKVKIAKGWATLEGDVDYYYQKEAAEHAVRRITGVKGITNLITVRARALPADVKEKIRNALHRGAEFDAERIQVEVDGNKGTLKGTVRSFAERRNAERAVRNFPGITEVENKLIVDPSISLAGV